jgi:hypothetical protein
VSILAPYSLWQRASRDCHSNPRGEHSNQSVKMAVHSEAASRPATSFGSPNGLSLTIRNATCNDEAGKFATSGLLFLKKN